jgi:NTE family protein
MKIGLALSGGGCRAIGYHLGVLARLADSDLLEEVDTLSTVSGGSMIAALMYMTSNGCWPDSKHFRRYIVPYTRRLLTTFDFNATYLRTVFSTPTSLLRSRAHFFAQILADHWGITGSLQDLPDRPRWFISALCYDTGQLWVFNRRRMGGAGFGYTHRPDYPLHKAVAASGAVPGIFGALMLDTREWRWFRRDQHTGQPEAFIPALEEIRLWDGGVYDNQGLETVFIPGKGFRAGIDFLLVSDASRESTGLPYNTLWAIPDRLLGITARGVQEKRLRALQTYLHQHNYPGRHMRIGSSCAHILARAGRPHDIAQVADAYLPDRAIHRVALMETTLRALSTDEFDMLFRHGYEVADCSLYAHAPREFRLQAPGLRQKQTVVPPVYAATAR